jgi:uncharacterized protein involved in tolerance to divalent cations
MEDYCRAVISATSKEEADRIADKLLTDKLVSGALIIKGPARFWWKGKIVEQEYFNILAFTLLKNKKRIIAEVRKIHSDEVPVIAFFKLDGNEDFLEWIKASVE